MASGSKTGAERPPHVDALPAAALLVPAGAPQRRCELQTRHQPVELCELTRLECVEALASQQLLVAGQRQWHLDRGRFLVTLQSRSLDGDDDRLSSGEATVCGSWVGSPLSARPPKTEKNTASKTWTCVGSETKTATGGPVQPPARDRLDEAERPCEVGRACRGGGQARVAQAPAQSPYERRQVDVDRLDAEHGFGQTRVSHGRS